MLKRLWTLWDDDDAPDPVRIDPASVASVAVGCLAGVGILFWTLWAFLVYEGGLWTKAGPFLRAVLTSETFKHLNDSPLPDGHGVFEGWAVNVAALGVFLFFVFVFRRLTGRRSGTKV